MSKLWKIFCVVVPISFLVQDSIASIGLEAQNENMAIHQMTTIYRMPSKFNKQKDYKRYGQDRKQSMVTSKNSRKKKMHKIERRKDETAKSLKMDIYDIIQKLKFANFERADPFNKISLSDPIVGQMNGPDMLDRDCLDPFETGLNLLVSASSVDHFSLKVLHQILLGVMLMTFPQNKKNIHNNSQ